MAGRQGCQGGGEYDAEAVRIQIHKTIVSPRFFFAVAIMHLLSQNSSGSSWCSEQERNKFVDSIGFLRSAGHASFSRVPKCLRGSCTRMLLLMLSFLALVRQLTLHIVNNCPGNTDPRHRGPCQCAWPRRRCKLQQPTCPSCVCRQCTRCSHESAASGVHAQSGVPNINHDHANKIPLGPQVFDFWPAIENRTAFGIVGHSWSHRLPILIEIGS